MRAPRVLAALVAAISTLTLSLGVTPAFGAQARGGVAAIQQSFYENSHVYYSAENTWLHETVSAQESGQSPTTAQLTAWTTSLYGVVVAFNEAVKGWGVSDANSTAQFAADVGNLEAALVILRGHLVTSQGEPPYAVYPWQTSDDWFGTVQAHLDQVNNAEIPVGTDLGFYVPNAGSSAHPKPRSSSEPIRLMVIGGNSASGTSADAVVAGIDASKPNELTIVISASPPQEGYITWNVVCTLTNGQTSGTSASSGTNLPITFRPRLPGPSTRCTVDASAEIHNGTVVVTIED